jgi:hypothetical protein
MELKEFVKKVLVDLVDAVEEARTESTRDMKLLQNKDSGQTIEFDIAVTVEDNTAHQGQAGIKVFKFIEAGGEASKEMKNSSVSRISFGVYIDTFTKEEDGRTVIGPPSRVNY